MSSRFYVLSNWFNLSICRKCVEILFFIQTRLNSIKSAEISKEFCFYIFKHKIFYFKK